MRKAKRWGVLVPVFLLLPTVAMAQDAKEVLGKVAATYQNFQSCHFEGTTLAETRAANSHSRYETRFEIAVVKPNKIKVEFQYPGAGSWVRLSDGKTLYRYRSMNKELKKADASPYDLDILHGTVISDYQSMTDGLKNAQLQGSEPVQVEGKPINCYVVEAQYERRNDRPGIVPLPTKYWIDKARFIVLRQVAGTKSGSGATQAENIRTTTFTLARINEPVPDTLFVFNTAIKK